eukprot:2894277-Amphidinium_carterae.1
MALMAMRAWRNLVHASSDSYLAIADSKSSCKEAWLDWNSSFQALSDKSSTTAVHSRATSVEAQQLGTKKRTATKDFFFKNGRFP